MSESNRQGQGTGGDGEGTRRIERRGDGRRGEISMKGMEGRGREGGEAVK